MKMQVPIAEEGASLIGKCNLLMPNPSGLRAQCHSVKYVPPLPAPPLITQQSSLLPNQSTGLCLFFSVIIITLCNYLICLYLSVYFYQNIISTTAGVCFTVIFPALRNVRHCRNTSGPHPTSCCTSLFSTLNLVLLGTTTHTEIQITQTLLCLRASLCECLRVFSLLPHFSSPQPSTIWLLFPCMRISP